MKHGVGDLDVAGDDFLLRILGGLDRVGREQILVVLVQRVPNAVAFQAEHVQPGAELVVRDVLHDPRVALLFLIPGFDETLRANGSAVLTTSEADIAACTTERRAPKLVVRVAVEAAYHETFASI